MSTPIARYAPNKPRLRPAIQAAAMMQGRTWILAAEPAMRALPAVVTSIRAIRVLIRWVGRASLS